MSDFKAIKEKQQQTWAAGDFSIVAWNTVFAGELLCEAVDLRAGQKVLDVATGSGNTALSAARRFCEVTGIDYVPALLEKAKQRAEIEQLQVNFTNGDCENILFEDGWFDVVLSTFGSMFAPHQEKAAQELIRVCKQGGKIGLTCWTPEGFWGNVFKLQKKYVPHAADLRSPVEWGTEQRLKELFGTESKGKITKRVALFRFTSTDHFINFFKTHFGPILKTFEALNEEQQQAYTKDLEEMLNQFNKSDDETLVIHAEYLEVVITKN